MSEPGHISATSISAYKACPKRYRLGYVEALRPVQEAQPLRMGSAWHKGLEILRIPGGTKGIVSDYPIQDALVEIGRGNRVDIAVTCADRIYRDIPDWADPTEWAVEREIVVNALVAYHWLYGEPEDSEWETVATELPFNLPLVNPETGRPTQKFRRVGKIDAILRHKATGRLVIGENKSTSKPIDTGSTYWDRLRMDTQSKFYIMAARALEAVVAVKPDGHRSPYLPPSEDGTTYKAKRLDVSGLLHDVFHKPGIRPKKLTQAESKKFVEDGLYCDQEFKVSYLDGPPRESDNTPTKEGFQVDGVLAEVEAGKKEGTFTIRETPGMFGARLLQDMTERPEFYFARREIAFTDQELKEFEYQIWALQRNMAEMERTGHWFTNEGQCEATFRCQYAPICYNNMACCDGVTVPPGFKRLHTEGIEQTSDQESE